MTPETGARPPREVSVTFLGTELPGRACGPYSDIHVALQVGRAHVGLVPGDAPSATWETTIRLSRDDHWEMRGPAVQGPRGARFFYLAWVGRAAGGEAPAMFRRAKLMVEHVPEDVLAAAWEGGALVARLGLTDASGMPRCARVIPPVVRWDTR
ncbi:MAG: DUF5990 family protein [Myxococcota bacterium]